MQIRNKKRKALEAEIQREKDPNFNPVEHIVVNSLEYIFGKDPSEWGILCKPIETVVSYMWEEKKRKPLHKRLKPKKNFPTNSPSTSFEPVSVTFSSGTSTIISSTPSWELTESSDQEESIVDIEFDGEESTSITDHGVITATDAQKFNYYTHDAKLSNLNLGELQEYINILYKYINKANQRIEHYSNIMLTSPNPAINELRNSSISNRDELLNKLNLIKIYISNFKESVVKQPLEEINKKESFNDKIKQGFRSFYSATLGYPTVIKGYIINDKIFTNNSELALYASTNKILWDLTKMILRVSRFNYETNEIETKTKIVSFKPLSKVKESLILSVLPLLVDFKICSFKNSNNFFNDKIDREKFLYTKTPFWKVKTVKSLIGKNRLSNSVVSIENPDKGDEIYFLLGDCKVENKELCGYSIPMDKTITINSIVKVKDSKISKYNLKQVTNTEAEVISIKPNSSSKKISKNSNNHRLDIITIRNRFKEMKVYAQDLKFIKNKSIKTNDSSIKKESGNKEPYHGISKDWFESTIQNIYQSEYIQYTSSPNF